MNNILNDLVVCTGKTLEITFLPGKRQIMTAERGRLSCLEG